MDLRLHKVESKESIEKGASFDPAAPKTQKEFQTEYSLPSYTFTWPSFRGEGYSISRLNRSSSEEQPS